jgi:hypothetical protein
MSLPIRILPLRIMVHTGARMFPFLWEGAGEDTATTTTNITAGIAMEGIRGMGDIHRGIGKQAAV